MQTLPSIERIKAISQQMKEQADAMQEADAAFDFAIDTGRLSADRNSPLYAGNFMYMGTKNGRAMFKNTNTRQYL